MRSFGGNWAGISAKSFTKSTSWLFRSIKHLLQGAEPKETKTPSRKFLGKQNSINLDLDGYSAT